MDKKVFSKQIELFQKHIDLYYHEPHFKKDIKQVFDLTFTDNEGNQGYDVFGNMEILSSDVAGFSDQIIHHGKTGFKYKRVKDATQLYKDISRIISTHQYLFIWADENELSYPCVSLYISLNLSLTTMLLKYIEIYLCTESERADLIKLENY